VVALQTGVKVVVGQIGGDDNWKLKDEHLRINVWNERSRLAEFAQIDALEIIGGMNIPYDWAISAVVEKLHDHGLNGPIPVRLIDVPFLAPDTLQRLRALDPALSVPWA
jgi:hypothetical protein